MARAGSNHKGGRPKGSLAKSTQEALESKALLIEMLTKKIGLVTEALVAKALEGDVTAIKEIYDRTYGKSVTSIEMSGKDGKDLPTPIMMIQDVLRTNNSNVKNSSTD